MLVMKFGGSSVANRAQIEKVLGIVAGRALRRPVVVSSAHKGITDALVLTARTAAAGAYDPETVLARQRTIARELGCSDGLLAPLFSELCDLLRGVHLVKEISPRSLDYIASFGERMSVRCLADFFTRHGTPATAHDVWDLGFITDSNFGCARPTAGFEERARTAFAALPSDRIPVVTGFIGKNESGEITTVGRNGSDLTATLLGAALEAEEVEIWSDTDGVMTADPRLVPTARNIPYMRFDEAAELAYFGSRVLHPSTLLPAMQRGIPVRVLNTNHPAHPGTVIQEVTPPNPNPVTSIAYTENQSVLTIGSTRMFGEVGFLGEVFAACARHAVVVDMVTTSEVSISLTAQGNGALTRAAEELRSLGDVSVRTGRTVLVVVGQHLATRAGVAAEILRAVGEQGVNVEMLGYAAGAINLSMVIVDADVARAVEVLHRTLFAS